MRGFLVWYSDDTTRHFETVEDVMNNLENADIVTDEIYVNGQYIGEVDYLVDEFIEEWG